MGSQLSAEHLTLLFLKNSEKKIIPKCDAEAGLHITYLFTPPFPYKAE